MHEDLLELLKEHNPEALLLEPRECFDPAIVAIDDGVAVYNGDLLIECMMAYDSCCYDDAADWVHYNTVGSLQGRPNEPIIRWLFDIE
tara:strand:+ start:3346 stop:3609 length:264 start_codon:yes stop_codon:yes gene_type:complete